MRDSTVVKAVLASLLVLGLGTPVSHAQGIFFGMMSAQTPTVYNLHNQKITEQQAKDMYMTMDINKDGGVTREEFEAGYHDFFADDMEGKLMAKRYKALDISNNGKVTQAEFVANRNVPVDDRFALVYTPNGGREEDDDDSE